MKLAGPDYLGKSVNIILQYKLFVQEYGFSEQVKTGLKLTFLDTWIQYVCNLFQDAKVHLINQFLHQMAGVYGLSLDQMRTLLKNIDR